MHHTSVSARKTEAAPDRSAATAPAHRVPSPQPALRQHRRTAAGATATEPSWARGAVPRSSPQAAVGLRALTVPLLAPAGGRVQARREVAELHDPAEREAEAVATRLVHGVPTSPTAIAHTAAVPLPVAGELVPGTGQPLAAAVRATAQARFGYDFAAVRVHLGADADALAAALTARAYTVGPHLIFARGRYAPHTTDGLALLFHELVHVIQQGHAAPLRPTLRIAARPRPHVLHRDAAPAANSAAPAANPAAPKPATEVPLDLVYVSERALRSSPPGIDYVQFAWSYYAGRGESVDSFPQLFRSIYKKLPQTQPGPAAATPRRAYLRELTLVAHGSPDGTLRLGTTTHGPNASFSDHLDKVLGPLQSDRALNAAYTQVKAAIDQRTKVILRACNIGRNEAALSSVRTLFGGKPTVLAPRVWSFYQLLEVARFYSDPALAPAGSGGFILTRPLEQINQILRAEGKRLLRSPADIVDLIRVSAPGRGTGPFVGTSYQLPITFLSPTKNLSVAIRERLLIAPHLVARIDDRRYWGSSKPEETAPTTEPQAVEPPPAPLLAPQLDSPPATPASAPLARATPDAEAEPPPEPLSPLPPVAGVRESGIATPAALQPEAEEIEPPPAPLTQTYPDRPSELPAQPLLEVEPTPRSAQPQESPSLAELLPGVDLPRLVEQLRSVHQQPARVVKEGQEVLAALDGLPEIGLFIALKQIRRVEDGTELLSTLSSLLWTRHSAAGRATSLQFALAAALSRIVPQLAKTDVDLRAALTALLRPPADPASDDLWHQHSRGYIGLFGALVKAKLDVEQYLDKKVHTIKSLLAVYTALPDELRASFLENGGSAWGSFAWGNTTQAEREMVQQNFLLGPQRDAAVATIRQSLKQEAEALGRLREGSPAAADRAARLRQLALLSVALNDAEGAREQIGQAPQELPLVLLRALGLITTQVPKDQDGALIRGGLRLLDSGRTNARYVLKGLAATKGLRIDETVAPDLYLAQSNVGGVLNVALSLPRLRLAALSFLFGAVRVLGGESLLGGLAIRLQLPSTKNAKAAPRFDASLSTAQFHDLTIVSPGWALSMAELALTPQSAITADGELPALDDSEGLSGPGLRRLGVQIWLEDDKPVLKDLFKRLLGVPGPVNDGAGHVELKGSLTIKSLETTAGFGVDGATIENVTYGRDSEEVSAAAASVTARGVHTNSLSVDSITLSGISAVSSTADLLALLNPVQYVQALERFGTLPLGGVARTSGAKAAQADNPPLVKSIVIHGLRIGTQIKGVDLPPLDATLTGLRGTVAVEFAEKGSGGTARFAQAVLSVPTLMVRGLPIHLLLPLLEGERAVLQAELQQAGAIKDPARASRLQYLEEFLRTYEYGLKTVQSAKDAVAARQKSQTEDPDALRQAQGTLLRAQQDLSEYVGTLTLTLQGLSGSYTPPGRPGEAKSAVVALNSLAVTGENGRTLAAVDKLRVDGKYEDLGAGHKRLSWSELGFAALTTPRLDLLTPQLRISARGGVLLRDVHTQGSLDYYSDTKGDTTLSLSRLSIDQLTVTDPELVRGGVRVTLPSGQPITVAGVVSYGFTVTLPADDRDASFAGTLGVFGGLTVPRLQAAIGSGIRAAAELHVEELAVSVGTGKSGERRIVLGLGATSLTAGATLPAGAAAASASGLRGKLAFEGSRIELSDLDLDHLRLVVPKLGVGDVTINAPAGLDLLGVRGNIAIELMPDPPAGVPQSKDRPLLKSLSVASLRVERITSPRARVRLPGTDVVLDRQTSLTNAIVKDLQLDWDASGLRSLRGLLGSTIDVGGVVAEVGKTLKAAGGLRGRFVAYDLGRRRIILEGVGAHASLRYADADGGESTSVEAGNPASGNTRTALQVAGLNAVIDLKDDGADVHGVTLDSVSARGLTINKGSGLKLNLASAELHGVHLGGLRIRVVKDDRRRGAANQPDGEAAPELKLLWVEGSGLRIDGIKNVDATVDIRKVAGLAEGTATRISPRITGVIGRTVLQRFTYGNKALGAALGARFALSRSTRAQLLAQAATGDRTERLTLSGGQVDNYKLTSALLLNFFKRSGPENQFAPTTEWPSFFIDSQFMSEAGLDFDFEVDLQGSALADLLSRADPYTLPAPETESADAVAAAIYQYRQRSRDPGFNPIREAQALRGARAERREFVRSLPRDEHDALDKRLGELRRGTAQLPSIEQLRASAANAAPILLSGAPTDGPLPAELRGRGDQVKLNISLPRIKLSYAADGSLSVREQLRKDRDPRRQRRAGYDVSDSYKGLGVTLSEADAIRLDTLGLRVGGGSLKAYGTEVDLKPLRQPGSSLLAVGFSQADLAGLALSLDLPKLVTKLASPSAGESTATLADFISGTPGGIFARVAAKRIQAAGQVRLAANDRGALQLSEGRLSQLELEEFHDGLQQVIRGLEFVILARSLPLIGTAGVLGLVASDGVREFARQAYAYAGASPVKIALVNSALASLVDGTAVLEDTLKLQKVLSGAIDVAVDLDLEQKTLKLTLNGAPYLSNIFIPLKNGLWKISIGALIANLQGLSIQLKSGLKQAEAGPLQIRIDTFKLLGLL